MTGFWLGWEDMKENGRIETKFVNKSQSFTKMAILVTGFF